MIHVAFAVVLASALLLLLQPLLPLQSFPLL